ncbi:hypothetical protein OEZ86_006120 [Tetradesmus obliquus]|nr:hypothetical protein OEZ86_006120 [Tetradesmus obliquus]
MQHRQITWRTGHGCMFWGQGVTTVTPNVIRNRTAQSTSQPPRRAGPMFFALRSGPRAWPGSARWRTLPAFLLKSSLSFTCTTSLFSSPTAWSPSSSCVGDAVVVTYSAPMISSIMSISVSFPAPLACELVDQPAWLCWPGRCTRSAKKMLMMWAALGSSLLASLSSSSYPQMSSELSSSHFSAAKPVKRLYTRGSLRVVVCSLCRACSVDRQALQPLHGQQPVWCQVLLDAIRSGK